MINSIKFAPTREIKKINPSQDTALISIHDSDLGIDATIPDTGWGFLSHIGIEDAAYSIEEIQQYGTNFWTYFDGCANKRDALQILLFFKQIESNDNIAHIIVQSPAGRSRSAAIAKFYAERNHLVLDGDISRANSLIYQLLQNPGFYDEAFDKYVNIKPKEEVKENEKCLGWAMKKLLEKITTKFSI